MKKKFSVSVNKKIEKFSKTIFVESDKSISHRSLLIASQCIGISSINNILESEDIKNTILCLKKLPTIPFFCNQIKSLSPTYYKAAM